MSDGNAHGRWAATVYLSPGQTGSSAVSTQFQIKSDERPSAGGGIGRSRHGACTRNGIAAKKGCGASVTRFLGAVRLPGRSWRRVPRLLLRGSGRPPGPRVATANGRLRGPARSHAGAWPRNEMSVGIFYIKMILPVEQVSQMGCC